MKRLGHEHFYVHGGDLGGLIATNMARIYLQNVIGLHSVPCVDLSPVGSVRQFLGSLIPSLYYTPEEVELVPSMGTVFEFMLRASGYSRIQATKPDTVDVGLSLSPSTLAVYILEKLSTSTNAGYMNLDKDGELFRKFTMDQLLDNIMVYWVTNSITTSVRLYSEGFSTRQSTYNFDRIPVKVPTGCVRLGHESKEFQPRAILEGHYKNIVRYTDALDGGRFFGFGDPDFLASEIIQFVSAVEKSAPKI